MGVRGDVGARGREIAIAGLTVELGSAKDQFHGLRPLRQIPDGVGVQTAMDGVGDPVTVGTEADAAGGHDGETHGVGGGVAPLVDDFQAV